MQDVYDVHMQDRRIATHRESFTADVNPLLQDGIHHHRNVMHNYNAFMLKVETLYQGGIIRDADIPSILNAISFVVQHNILSSDRRSYFIAHALLLGWEHLDLLSSHTTISYLAEDLGLGQLPPVQCQAEELIVALIDETVRIRRIDHTSLLAYFNQAVVDRLARGSEWDEWLYDEA